MAEAPQPTRVFRFGSYEADLDNRELRKNGLNIRLQGQPFEVLALLLEHSGRLVTREQLRAHLWSAGTVVEFDHSVHTAVTKLREALGDDADNPRFVATVPRHGYRFIAPVLTPVPLGAPGTGGAAPVTPDTTTPSTERRPRWQRRIVSGSPRLVATIGILAALTLGITYFFIGRVSLPEHTAAERQVGGGTPIAPTPRLTTVGPDQSVAVLPFVDMSESRDQEYFADGLAEELLDLLARVPGLHVIARTSSFSFKGKAEDVPSIARKLRVANILEGSIRKSGNRLRVSTQLIRGADGEHIWSSTYDRDVKDVFEVQDEIAAAVVDALKVQLLPSRKPVNVHRSANPDAYNQYLIARQLDGAHAIEAYRKATELDPAYAAAYAGIAQMEFIMAFPTEDAAGKRRALAAANKAVEVAPDQAVGYSARGLMRMVVHRDWAGALSDAEKAIALDPDDQLTLNRYADLLSRLGRQQESIELVRKRLALDPWSDGNWVDLGCRLTGVHDFAAAEEALQRAAELGTDSYAEFKCLGLLRLLQGRPAEALAEFRQINWECVRLPAVAMAEHSLGHDPESLQALNAAQSRCGNSWAYHFAQAYAWRGDKDKAFEALERAYQYNDTDLGRMKTDVQIANLRDDPRFAAMLHKLKLPE